MAVILSAEAWRRLQGGRPDLRPALEAWRARRSDLNDADVDALRDPLRDAPPDGIDG